MFDISDVHLNAHQVKNPGADPDYFCDGGGGRWMGRGI